MHFGMFGTTLVQVNFVLGEKAVECFMVAG